MEVLSLLCSTFESSSQNHVSASLIHATLITLGLVGISPIIASGSALKRIKKVRKFGLFNFLQKKRKKFSLGSIGTMSLLSFIFGLLSLILVWLLPLIGLLFAIGGVVFGILGLKEDSKIFALIGLISGALVLFIALLLIIFVASIFAAVL